jgi:hypothetical protein
MPDIRVVLYDDGARSISLRGIADPIGDTYELTVLEVPGGEAAAQLTLATKIEGTLSAHLMNLAAANDFRFNASVTVAVQFQSALVFGAVLPFDVPFDATASLSAQLFVRLRPDNPSGAVILRLEGPGRGGGIHQPAKLRV